MNLFDFTEQCFSEDGWLVTEKGFRYEPAQLRYAMDVATWLTSGKETPLALLEGGTGTGKTLGYLVSLLIQVALTNQRAVIATHTISLQNQMIDKGDLDLALEYLSHLRIKQVTCQQLVGRQEYIDPERFEEAIQSLQDEGEVISNAKQLVEAAYVSASKDGLINVFETNYGPLPTGLSVFDICLKSDSDGDINKGYSKQRELAEKADIVITSHTMLLLNRSYGGGGIFESKDAPIRHVIVDEADMLSMAAESLSSKKLHPKQILSHLSVLRPRMKPKEKAGATRSAELIDQMHAYMTKFALGKQEVMPVIFTGTGGGFETECQKLTADLQSSLSSILSVIKKIPESSMDAAENRAMTSLIEYSGFLRDFVGGRDSGHLFMIGASWSPKRKIPSLEIQRPFPAQRIKTYWLGDSLPSSKVMFTSATLTNGRSGSFQNFKGDIRTFGSQYFSVESSHSPERFGKVKYVVAPTDTAKPVISSEKYAATLNSKWISYAATMVREASLGGPTLCLCVSFKEAAAIANKLQAGTVHLHQQGESLQTHINRFQIEGGVLITPSAWEGISIRDLNGDQLVVNLVVTRVPFRPPAPFRDAVLCNYLMKAGSITKSKADGIVRAMRYIEAIRKLRQGFGRLIRHGADSGTIWVADPRFANGRGLQDAIPQRYWEEFKRARTLSAETGLEHQTENKKKEVPQVILEWL